MNNFLNKKLPMFLSIVLAALFILAVSFGFNSNSADAAWYASGGTWGYRKMITIDKNRVVGGSDFTNFPVLISVTDTDLKNNAQSDGDDILFTSSDGSTKLDHEIELYTSSTGQLIAWVEIPTLSGTADTVIYIYYGNGSASSQQNASGTWNSDYRAVYHLPNGTTLSGNDSTGNNFDGEATGATATSGQIDGGANFDGNDYASSTPTGSMTTWTLSTWINLTSHPTYAGIMFSRGGTYNYAMHFFSTGNNLSYTVNSDTTYLWDSGVTVPTGSWAYAVISVNTSLTTATVCSAGTCSRATNSYTAPLIVPSAPLHLGQDPFGGRFITGKLDEARVSTVARSDNWIATEYNNQYSPNTFYAYGSANVENRAKATPAEAVRNGVKLRGGVKFR